MSYNQSLVKLKASATSPLKKVPVDTVVVEATKPRTTAAYDQWINGLRDATTRARIIVRVDRLCAGNAGDHRNLTDGVSELKIDVGPGYRVYYTKKEVAIIVLLAGGSKATQAADIVQAIVLAKNL